VHDLDIGAGGLAGVAVRHAVRAAHGVVDLRADARAAALLDAGRAREFGLLAAELERAAVPDAALEELLAEDLAALLAAPPAFARGAGAPELARRAAARVAGASALGAPLEERARLCAAERPAIRVGLADVVLARGGGARDAQAARQGHEQAEHAQGGEGSRAL
jgi:hypothetical protein